MGIAFGTPKKGRAAAEIAHAKELSDVEHID
jgi:hypothetical protein